MERSAGPTAAVPELLQSGDALYHERLHARASFLRSGAQALIVLNGGGAVALLAFLQAVWTSAPDLVHWIVVALAAQSVGVIAAATLPFLNHSISLRYEGRADSPASPDYEEITRLERRRKRVTILAFACFAVSLAVMMAGVEWNILLVDGSAEPAMGT